MKIFKYVLLPLVFSLMAFSTAHKFYVSVTQIDYIEDKQSVQIISRIFVDDFESLIRERYDNAIVLEENNESEKVDLYIERYLKSKIKVKINNEDVIAHFIGKEYELDIMYCYLEIENVEEIKSFEVTNQILFDMFQEQQNIVRTNINSKQKSYMLTTQNDKAQLSYE